MSTRIRRLQFRVEHQQVTLSVTESQTVASSSSDPGRCPQCGAGWVVNTEAALQGLDVNAELLQAALVERRLHLRALPGGQVQICERSLQELAGEGAR